MDVIGIICEYNPFHNGHLYHLQRVKELYPDSLVILVMSGYFSQRGEISVLSKEDKVKIALSNGIDIVLELPFIFSVQASDIFAYYSVRILYEFGVRKIVFGSEENDILKLKSYVSTQLSDSSYDERVKSFMDSGLSYPAAMAKALGSEVIRPNDLLGLSYVKAIYQINKDIEPVSIKRTNDFHDQESDEEIISASNIRNKLVNGLSVLKYVPVEVNDKLINISNESLFNLLKFKILTDKDLSIYLDVDEGIEFRLKRYVNEAHSFEDFIGLVKTKRYTYNRIKRMFMHILIGLTKEDMKTIGLDYVKVLGFNKKGRSYLKSIRKEMGITTNIEVDSSIYNYELKAAYLYEEATKVSLGNFDLKGRPIIIDEDNL